MEPQATNKSKTGYIVTIVILAIATAGLLTALILTLVLRGDCDCAGGQESGDDSSDNSKVIQRNTAREDDISRFMTAANDYQVNNGGKLPWSDTGTNTKWVQRYVDDTCSLDYTVGSLEHYKCGAGSTGFRDPDGIVYRIRYVGKLDKKYSLNSVMFDWPNNHELVVATNAKCGSDGTFEVGYGPRQFAMAYRLEGGSITCNDNH